MNPDWPFSPEFQIFQQILLTAKKIAAFFSQSSIRSFIKTNQTPVTVADCAIQIFLIDQIHQYFPDDEIIAEEEDSSFDESMIDQISCAFHELGIIVHDEYQKIIQYRGFHAQRQWTIDPIDGTEGYRRGLAYAIGIGFLINHTPHFSAIAVPNFQDSKDGLFFAELHKGAYIQMDDSILNPIHVASKSDLSQAIIIKSLHHDLPISGELITTFHIPDIISMDGMGKFCQVAMGNADIYFRPLIDQEIYIWDYCPGHLLIHEAGGLFTGLNGEIPQYSNKNVILQSNGIIATNKTLHPKLIEYFSNKRQ